MSGKLWTMAHLRGRLTFLLFCTFTIVIAAPPHTLETLPPASFLSSDKNTGLNRSHTAAYDALLNFFPPAPPTNLPHSTATNTLTNPDFPPDPYLVPTEVGDYVAFSDYNHSPHELDLHIILVLARDDAIQHLKEETPDPMPEQLTYRNGFGIFDMEVGPEMNWVRWGWALRQIGIFQFREGSISFNFRLITKGAGEQLAIGKVRADG